MKNLNLIVLISILLINCSPYKTKEETKKIHNNMQLLVKELDYNGYEINTYVIDSCEYIAYTQGSSGVSLIHKANCNNPIHKIQIK